MKRRKIHYIRDGIAAALLLFIVLSGLILNFSVMEFSSIDGTVVRGDEIYGINSSEIWTEVFRVSAGTGVGEFYRIDRISHKGIVTLSEPRISEDGKYYFDKLTCKDDGSVELQTFRWDPGHRRITDCTGAAGVPEKESGSGVSAGEPNGLSVLNYDNGSVITLKADGAEYSVKGVRIPIKQYLIYMLMALAVSALVFLILAAFEYQYLTRYRMGLRMRLSLVTLIPILLLSPVAEYFLRSFFYTYACRSVMNHCSDTAALNTGTLDEALLERIIEGREELTDEKMEALWLYGDPQGVRKSLSELGEEDELFIDESFTVAYQDGDELVLIGPEKDLGSNRLIIRDGSLKGYLETVFKNMEPGCRLADLGARPGAFAFVPSVLDSGRVILVGSYMPMNQVLAEFHERRVRIEFSLLAIVLLIIAVMLLVISSCLDPLDDLKEAVMKEASGDITARSKVSGLNEVSHTAISFNRMADQIEQQSEGADSYKVQYQAFLPSHFLHRITGNNLSTILTPGTCYETEAVIAEFRGPWPEASSDASFVRKAIAESKANGAYMIRPVTERNMVLAYVGQTEPALGTVVELARQQIGEGGTPVPAGIASEKIRLYVVGNAERMAVDADDSGEAGQLSKIADILGIPVILTEQAYLDTIQKDTKYHFRLLGCIGCDGYAPERPLYELLDAEEAWSREKKEFTQSIFEDGVRAYASGDYFYARNQMVRVLKAYPEDLAARSYLLNCDRKEKSAVCQALS